MSGHNPHSHLSQPPNSSWNPLQIPSYIPRQPQVAHMSSNERSLVRSPLTWHTPTPPDALYGYISAKHKNLDLNPLTFVRGPSPFGSVDLTIQSSRNNTASPRNLVSPSSDYASIHNKQISHNIITNNLPSSGVGLGPGVIQTTGSVRDKFSSSNGTNCNDISSSLSNSSGTGGGSGVGGLFIRDARQINNDLLKMSSRDPNELFMCSKMVSMMNEQPVELVNQTAKLHVIPTSPRRLSPHITPLLNHHTVIPSESTSPAPSSSLNKVGINLDLTHNNHISPLPPSTQQILSSANVANETISYENSPLCSSVQSPSNITSNDDSVDSNTSKTRRRRKPNRIIRVPNDSDDSLPSNDKPNMKIYKKDIMDSISCNSHNSDKNENCLKLDEDKTQISTNTLGLIDTTNITKIDNQIENRHHHHHFHQQQQQHLHPHSHPHSLLHHHMPQQQQQLQFQKHMNELQQPKENLGKVENYDGRNGNGWTSSVSLPVINQEVENNKAKSVIVDNANAVTPTNLSVNAVEHCRVDNNLKNTVIERSKSQKPNKSEKCDNTEVLSRNCINSNNKSSSKLKEDQDDIETIDKIAAMIANSNENEEITTVNCLNNLSQKPINNTDNQSENKLTDLTEILEESNKSSMEYCDPSSLEKNNVTTMNQENSENYSKEMHYEEVENKLEEMFAGIEDEQPNDVVNSREALFNQTNDPALELITAQTDINNLSQLQEETLIDRNIPSTSKGIVSSHKKILQLTQSSKQSADVPSKKKRKTTLSISSSKKTQLSTPKKPKKQKQTGKISSNNKSVKEKIQEKEDPFVGISSNTGNDLKYKGPFVQLKSDGSINIVNAPIAEDDTEKQIKVKKTLSHSNPERNKIRGMHISTLSTKYDADTIDKTWMCVFCKKGPHKEGLGDLFGPYVVTTTCEEFQLSQKNPLEDEFLSKRTKAQMVQKFHNIPVVVTVSAQQKQLSTSTNSNVKKKKKGNITTVTTETSQITQKNQVNDPSLLVDVKDIYYGMLKVSETSYEVWLHEDCVVWSPGVYMIGSRIIGLESAIWSSTQYKCNICLLNGALIYCLERGCSKKAHKSCAKNNHWALMESEFKSYCDKHFPASTSKTIFNS